MFMPTNLFEENAATVSNKQPICHKKKNTYIVRLNGMLMDSSLHSMCQTTPLPVVLKNGEPQSQDGGWIKCTQFPNPPAAKMQAQYNILQSYMTDRMACTIIEYLDKYTGEPVAFIFPTGEYIPAKYKDTYMSKMNHATRRDFNRQLKLRKAAMAQLEMDHQQY